MRKFSISLTVVLALVAMLWGNCLSCPEVAAAQHGCCHKPQPAKADCHTQNLQNFVKTATDSPVVPLFAVLADLPSPVLVLVQRADGPSALAIPPDSSTPPLNLRV